MKHLKTIFFIGLLMFSLGTQPAKALFGLGDIVFDPSVFAKAVVAESTRIAQLAEDVATTISSGTTAAQQTLSTINQIIIRPMQDAMMLISIFKSADQIKALVLGSVTGEASLLITNPERYIKQQGVNAVKVDVNYVDKANGIYSDSIINSAVFQARERSNPEGTLASISQSTIPLTIQKDLCEDSKLTSIAINDVKNPTDGTYDTATMMARKQEIYSKLCVGDPMTDKVLAQALTTAGETTGAGGWDVFLAKTGGDNNFTRTYTALAEIEKKRILEEALKAERLATGNGIADKTECVNPQDGLVAACAESAITNLGYQMSESFKSAINAPLDILKNAYGTGGAVSSILGSITSIVGSVNSISQSLNQVQGLVSSVVPVSSDGNGDPTLQINLGGAPVTSSNSTVTTGGVTNVTTNTTTSFTQDLLNNPEGKKSIISPIITLLDTHTKALTDLGNSDNTYLSSIANYLSYLDSVGICYQQLITDFPAQTIGGVAYPSLANDPRVSSALAYYNSEKASTINLRTTITKEISLIAQTNTLITNTRNIITNSNSTQEIVATYDNYNNTIESNNLPSVTSSTSRIGEVLSYESKVKAAIQDYTGIAGAESYNGKLVIMKNTCTAIRVEESTKRTPVNSTGIDPIII